MVGHWSGTSSYHSILSAYVDQATTHGIRKIASSTQPSKRIFWICVFLISLGACCYHCSYLIINYASSPKNTITEEKDADVVEFPSVTVCNLNVIKKTFADEYFDMSPDSKRLKTNQSRKSCFRSELDLASKSAIDLSDTWLNLGVTKDNLSIYGHTAEDLIILCTYNSHDCFDRNQSFTTTITKVASPLFGLCHTISIRKNGTDKPVVVKQSGTTNGLRLTMNIQKEMYWNLVSAEFGVRILVHPPGTYPTLQRGGIIVSPGSSVHVGIKRSVSTRVPGREGSCTKSFENSKLIEELAMNNLDFDVSGMKYTYEYCNTLCQNGLLFTACACLDEQPKTTIKSTWKFCNPCNETQTACRTKFLKNFTEAGNLCDDVCKPACDSIRYTISLTKSKWPNLSHQQFVMNRSREKWSNVPEALGLLALPLDDDENITDFVNDTFFSENLLSAHLFIEEMIYMSIEERYSYTLPKLLADLGGCLGLYLGVSVISIIELIELFGSASMVGLCGYKNPSKIRSPHFARGRVSSRRHKRHRAGAGGTTGSYSSNFGRTHSFSKKKNNRIEADMWRPPFPILDPYSDKDSNSRRNVVIRRF